MSKLFNQATNNINSITTQDVCDWRGVIAKSKKEQSKSGTIYVPDITSRSDAQVEADSLNHPGLKFLHLEYKSHYTAPQYQYSSYLISLLSVAMTALTSGCWGHKLLPHLLYSSV